MVRTRVLHENAAGGGRDLELSGDGLLRVDMVVGAARVSRISVASGQHLPQKKNGAGLADFSTAVDI